MNVIRRQFALAFLLVTVFMGNLSWAIDYISANVFVSAKGFKSLEAAQQQLIANQKTITPLNQLTLKPKKPTTFHMTLHGFTIDTVQGLTTAQKKMLENFVTEKLKEAAETELKNTLNVLKIKNQKGIVLPFDHIEIFNEFLVAVFNLRGTATKPSVLARLADNIEKTFNDLLKKSTLLHNKNNFSQFPITGVKRTYATIKPHVTLAKITDKFSNKINPYAGTVLQAPTPIANFVMSKPEAVATAFWLQK